MAREDITTSLGRIGLEGKGPIASTVARRLEAELMESETVQALMTCKYEKEPSYAVLTDRRIIVLGTGIFKKKISSFSFKKISDIEVKSGLAAAALKLSGSGLDAELTRLNVLHAKAFMDAAREYIY
jgi:hypothetical protein